MARQSRDERIAEHRAEQLSEYVAPPRPQAVEDEATAQLRKDNKNCLRLMQEFSAVMATRFLETHRRFYNFLDRDARIVEESRIEHYEVTRRFPYDASNLIRVLKSRYPDLERARRENNSYATDFQRKIRDLLFSDYRIYLLDLKCPDWRYHASNLEDSAFAESNKNMYAMHSAFNQVAYGNEDRTNYSKIDQFLLPKLEDENLKPFYKEKE